VDRLTRSNAYSCRWKLRWGTYEEAQAQARRINREEPYPEKFLPLEAYQCLACGDWHIGHLTREKLHRMQNHWGCK
jgi:hypothetical protein